MCHVWPQSSQYFHLHRLVVVLFKMVLTATSLWLRCHLHHDTCQYIFHLLEIFTCSARIYRSTKQFTSIWASNKQNILTNSYNYSDLRIHQWRWIMALQTRQWLQIYALFGYPQCGAIACLGIQDVKPLTYLLMWANSWFWFRRLPRLLSLFYGYCFSPTLEKLTKRKFSFP